jgi:hypothetical protein
MGGIKIGTINSTNVQVGRNNRMFFANELSKYEGELLKLFNENCATDIEKEELINALKNIEENGTDIPKSASKIKNFLASVGIGIVSSGIVDILHDLIEGKH